MEGEMLPAESGSHQGQQDGGGSYKGNYGDPVLVGQADHQGSGVGHPRATGF